MAELLPNLRTPRPIASQALAQVIDDGRSLSSVLNELWKTNPNAVKHRPMVQELCFGVMRWYTSLDAVAQKLLRKPVKKRDTVIHALLLTGLYQIIYMRVPDYAAVSETVSGARELKRPWAVGLVNGLLRHYLNDREEILSNFEGIPEFELAHPSWMLSLFQYAWPQDWQSIIAANNARPPMSLRVNTRKISRDDYLEKLQEVEITAERIPDTDGGLTLTTPCDVAALPGFDEGLCMVQDGGAQFAAPLLNLQAGQRVLDACAAPGGKTTHLLELEPGLKEVIALDCDQERLNRVQENLDRLDMQATLVHGNAMEPDTWWDKQPFDRILLDAPCSATGVIRRRPDIKWLRRDTDIAELSKYQSQLLEALWPLLKPGGQLLYVTCSILPQENHLLLANFLEQHSDAKALPIEGDWGVDETPGKQILPKENGMDGFYYALIEKA